MAFSQGQVVLLCAIGILLLARPAHAFGAGNIGSTSKVEGQNWRHGDIEDTLLTLLAAKAMSNKKFSKLDVKRVYFGNWLRDYSQAVDVGTVKYVSAEAIRILLWVLGFMTFGYGSAEFEVTTQRLGCYRPEEHIDNPKDYADNEDARQYDRRLRGPVDERRELAVNPETGLKNYIASENMGITTSAGMVRDLLSKSIQLGRSYTRSKNKKDLYEALRLLGTASHCLEDYAAHSNYVELALIELGERDIFPHVGRRTAIQIRGARNQVFPIVTGTFGGVDFLHSVCGEFDDKATQSEIQELEGTLQNAENNDGSVLQDLLGNIPDGIFGGKDEAGKVNELQQNSQAHQMQNTRISPRQPEEWAKYLDDTQEQLMPIIQWHDEVMQGITETVEKIPILPTIIDNIQEEMNKFVFSLIAPYVVPIIQQVKNELNTGSNEIIQSSKDKQHIVFNDDHSTDPTHSMLSKDHFSNILNEPAGKLAAATVKWVVPQVVAAWDDDRVDVNRTMDRIVNGVLHHPALRDQGQDGAADGRRAMFGVVEKWWREQDEREKDGLRRQLSREGVESGRNHKEGVHDHGHGSGKLAMANLHQKHDYPAGDAVDAIGATISEIAGGGNQGGNQGGRRPQSNQYAQGGQHDSGNSFGKTAGDAVGGGILGGIVGGLASALTGGSEEKHQTSGRQTESYSSSGQHGQSQYSHTEERHGGASGGYRQETSTYSSTSHGRNDNDLTSSNYGRQETSSYSGGGGNRRHDNDESGGYGSTQHGRRNDDNESSGYGRTQHSRRDDDNENSGYGGRQNRQDQDEYSSRQSGGYGQQTSSHGGNQSSYGRTEDDSGRGYGHQQSRGYGEETSSYGGRGDNETRGGGGYGRQEDSMPGGFGNEEPEGRSGGYGSQQDSYGGRRNDNDEQQQGSGYGGGYGRGGGDSYGRRDNDNNDEYSRY